MVKKHTERDQYNCWIAMYTKSRTALNKNKTLSKFWVDLELLQNTNFLKMAYYYRKYFELVSNFTIFNLPEVIGLKSAPTTGAPGEEHGTALGKRGFAGPPCPCIIAAICGGIICILQKKEYKVIITK